MIEWNRLQVDAYLGRLQANSHTTFDRDRNVSILTTDFAVVFVEFNESIEKIKGIASIIHTFPNG